MMRAEVLELARVRARIAELEAQLVALRSWEADLESRTKAPKDQKKQP